MKKFLVLMTMAAAMLCASAATPDRDAIKSIVKNEPARYEALTKRFVKGDATLSPEEVQIVYYGYADAPGFNPNAAYPALDAAYASYDLTHSLDMARMALESNPVSLPLLFKAYACAVTSPDAAVKATAEGYQTRINQLCDAIFSSGKGVIAESPYMLIRTSDWAPFLKNYLQPQQVMAESKIGDVNAVKVQLEGIDEPVILYYDAY